MKTCPNCSVTYDDVQKSFYKSKYTKDGLSSWCKQCKKDYQNEYRMRPGIREDILEYKRNWRLENVEEVNRIAREWMHDNYEYRKEYMREWQQNNPDRMAWHNQKRRQKNHDISPRQWDECRMYFNFRCAYCDKTWEQNKEESKKDLHKEHVDPHGANNLTNCIPACNSCNSRKWEYEFEDWYTKGNPIFSYERKEKIMKWLNQDHKQYL